MKICIDAGHGSNTAGKRTPKLADGTQYREHWANVGVANALYDMLMDYGFKLYKTGWDDTDATDDEDVALVRRQEAIRNQECDLVISAHFNAFGDGDSFNSAKGIGVYVHSDANCVGDSQRFADAVLSTLANGTPQKNRGVSKRALAMCNCRTMRVDAAILLELAFMTNKEEAKLMMEPMYWKECAFEITNGIIKYLTNGIPKKAVTPKSDPKDILWVQMMLNKHCTKLPVMLELDKGYGPKVTEAVKLYRTQLGYRPNTGKRISKKVLKALNK